MKKIKTSIIIIAVICLIVFILLGNKAKIEEKIANNVSLIPTVSVVQVERQEISENLSVIGTVTANLDVMVISETIGKVTAVKADVGDHVTAGSVLVVVDDELKLAGFKAAEVNYEKSKKDLERYEALNKSKAVTDNEIESARLGCKGAEAQYLVARPPIQRYPYLQSHCRDCYFPPGGPRQHGATRYAHCQRGGYFQTESRRQCG